VGLGHEGTPFRHTCHPNNGKTNKNKADNIIQEPRRDESTDSSLLTPGLDYTRLFISLTAAAGTICMSLLPSSPSLLRPFRGLGG